MGDIYRVITLGIGAVSDIIGLVLTGLNVRPYVTPANRKYVVPQEDRVYIVPQEDRTMVVTL